MGKKLTKNIKDCEHKKDKGKKKNDAASSIPTTMVLKVDMHCNECASKIIKSVRGVEALKLNLLIEGVESVKSKIETGKLNVTKSVDPAKLRDKLTCNKIKKNVNVGSPLPNKDNENKAKNSENKSKDKEASVTTVMLKVLQLCPCQGCHSRIHRAVLKTKGVHNVGIDKEKGILTVNGTMDVASLTRKLSKKCKRKIEVVSLKKDKEKENDKQKEKEKEKGKEKHGDKKMNNSANMKKKGDNDGDEGCNDNKNKDSENGKRKTEENIMNYIVPAYGYGDSSNYMEQYVSQMFNDENPYACHIM